MLSTKHRDAVKSSCILRVRKRGQLYVDLQNDNYVNPDIGLKLVFLLLKSSSICDPGMSNDVKCSRVVII